MVKRYPLHPLSIDACRWLTRHNASSEARRRHELGQFLVAHAKRRFGASRRCQETRSEQVERSCSKRRFLDNAAQLLHWRQGSMLFGKHLAGFGALHANDPAIQFCLHASQRQLGDVKAAQAFYSAFCDQCPEGAWHDAATQELWFATGAGRPPRPVGKCRFTDAKPFLDGKFDDACWQDHKPLVLRDAIHETARDYPTEAMLSYDEKFLYIALSCKHPVGQGLPPAKDRPRDADLRAFDRVSILLDLDRDYSTYFALAGRSARLRLRRLLGRHALEPAVVRGHPQRRGWLVYRGCDPLARVDRRPDRCGDRHGRAMSYAFFRAAASRPGPRRQASSRDRREWASWFSSTTNKMTDAMKAACHGPCHLIH